MHVILEGHDQAVPVEAGDTILASLLRAGVPFPYSCQSGNCGTCKCELVSGDVLELEYSEHALSRAERASNLILACRTQVWDDARIRRIDAGELVLHPSRVLGCRVLGVDDLTHDIRSLRLGVESGGPFIFSAGQYAQVEFAPGLSRHYSMANTPAESELLFYVQHMPGGRTSAWAVRELQPGDRVRVSGPLGVSYLRDAHPGPVLLVAGGSGLAPMRSILHTLLDRGAQMPIDLVFGVRTERDVYLTDHLAHLAAAHANFRFCIVVSEDVHALSAALPDPAGRKAYLAGPPALVESASTALQARGLALRDIHADAFYDQV